MTGCLNSTLNKKQIATTFFLLQKYIMQKYITSFLNASLQFHIAFGWYEYLQRIVYIKSRHMFDQSPRG